jgi:intein-encoded DNA endonuclease-like protein
MPPGTLYPLVDRLFNGQLDERLREWRGAGQSYDEIVFRLRTEHDINVSSETVRRWVNGEKS